ncbi:GFA family protein [Lysobacter enzymogenes]|uniref:CENP-V/GFA domain-containing protein n=1 Tax=Lysobacter enzymogenes TaxID=69 RepID=A0A3N2RD34_LYSEN|nr:hypothetical protein [Lysobacter enzymogenes]ROU05345.1 hypothetical protein D9T17_19685 [Lysobacter enzymogenes]
MRIDGACHCGNIRFVLDWRDEPDAIAARACDCTFCVKHGGVWTARAEAALRLNLRDPQRVSRYAFGTGTADFLVCAHCGAVPAAVSRIEGRLYAVVNVNTFEGFDPARIQSAPASLDGETESARLARRQRNWIGEVEIVEGA